MLNTSPPRRIMFNYWGQRGAMSQLTLLLARAARQMNNVDALWSVSRSNEMYEEFSRSGLFLFPVDTFSSQSGAITRLYRVAALRRALTNCLATHRIEAVVTLMSHVWTPFISDIPRRMGISSTVIVHDVKAHKGDRTALANHWLLHAARNADHIVTLSRFVAHGLADRLHNPRVPITPLFLPDLCYDGAHRRRPRDRTAPLRILFFGRILPYKGLSLFVSAAENVLARGIPIEIGVFGEGPLGQEGQRLRRLHAAIGNQWLAGDEIDAIFRSYDVLVLSHVEASQSGVAAVALSYGLPIVATPVGGLVEQVIDQRTGLLAASVSAKDLAAQIARLATEPGLYEKLSATIAEQAPKRSPQRFLERLIECCPDQRLRQYSSVAVR